MAKEIVNSPDTLKGYRVVQDEREIMEALSNGETVMHWESGNSMFPLLKNMEYCRISPVNINELQDKKSIVGKPVFCHFVYPGYGDCYMVHRCTDMYERDGETYFKIESTDNQVFGWTQDIYGIAESTNIFQDDLWS